MAPKPQTMITVKPGDGRLVRLPNGHVLPAEGAIIPDTLLMRKWIRIGDLVLIEPAPPPGAAPAVDANQKAKS